jgi:hypothetical protein
MKFIVVSNALKSAMPSRGGFRFAPALAAAIGKPSAGDPEGIERADDDRAGNQDVPHQADSQGFAHHSRANWKCIQS